MGEYGTRKPRGVARVPTPAEPNDDDSNPSGCFVLLALFVIALVTGFGYLYRLFIG